MIGLGLESGSRLSGLAAFRFWKLVSGLWSTIL